LDSTLSPGPAPSVPPPTYRDRSGGLVACGIIQILCGGLAALGIPFMLLGLVMSAKTAGVHAPIGASVSAVASYGFLAVLQFTLGIGSIRARRWARALTLIVSWIWLLVGVLATVLFTAVLPTSFLAGIKQASSINPTAPPPPVAFIAVILTFIIVLFAVFLVIIPLAFVIFFSRKDVEETCRRRDPVERWTDRRPLPVLAVSLVFAAAVPYYLLLGVTTPLFPFFGRYLVGIPAAIAFLAMAMLDAYLAVALFRLKITGWWVAVVALGLRLISSAITFRRGDLLGAYAKMGWKQAQLNAMGSNPLFMSGAILWWSLGFVLVFLGYVIWLRRYFQASAAPASPQPLDSLSPSGISDQQPGTA